MIEIIKLAQPNKIGYLLTMQTKLNKKGNMKNYIMAVMVLLTSTVYGQGTGAFASNCATLEMQQAAYNQSKANAIVVRDTASQQLQTHYAQLAAYYNNLAKEKQIAEKTAQQIAKDIQQKNKDQQQIDTDARLLTVDAAQKAKDAQQIEAEKRQVTKDLAQSEVDRNQKAKELELAAREAVLKDREEECNDMYVFCNEIKVILEKPDCDDKKVADHCKSKINRSGGGDGTNPGGHGNDNGFFNHHN